MGVLDQPVTTRGIALPNPGAGQYFWTAAGPTTTNSLVADQLRLQPWVLDKPLPLDRIGAEVTAVGAAGSKFRLGVYAGNGQGYPGALLLDAGQIDGVTVAVQPLTAALTLPPGVYWVGGAPQGGTPTMRCLQNVSPPVPISLGTTVPSSGATGAACYLLDGVSGALPATFPATPSGVAGVFPRILVRGA